MAYTREFECDNCGADGPVSIDFGVRAPEECICPECGVEGAKILPIIRKRASVVVRLDEPTTSIYTPPYLPPTYYTGDEPDQAAQDIIRDAQQNG